MRRPRRRRPSRRRGLRRRGQTGTLPRAALSRRASAHDGIATQMEPVADQRPRAWWCPEQGSRPFKSGQGASKSTLVWLGEMRAPLALVVFWLFWVVRRVAGIPPTRTVYAPVTGRDAPRTVPEETPAMPGLSPSEVGAVVPMLCAGMLWIRTLGTASTAVEPCAVFT